MKKKLFLKVVSAFLSLTIVTAMILIILACVSVNNKSILGFRLFIVLTGSMQGFINQGELIITKSEKEQSIKVGDVITFISSDTAIYGQINTHRIVKIENGGFYTKGDANFSQDTSPVSYNQILGKVIFHSPFLGWLIRALGKPLNMVIFLIFPIILIAISDIKNAKKKIKSLQNEEYDGKQ